MLTTRGADLLIFLSLLKYQIPTCICRRASSEERILDEDEEVGEVRQVQRGPDLQSEHAAAAMARVSSPELPQLDSNSLSAPRADLDMMSMQTPAPALLVGDNIDIHFSPGASAAKSAQRQFLASVLQGAQLPQRQVSTHLL